MLDGGYVEAIHHCQKQPYYQGLLEGKIAGALALEDDNVLPALPQGEDQLMLDVELLHTALPASRVAADPLDQMQCLQDKAGRRGRRSASPSHADAPESPQAESEAADSEHTSDCDALLRLLSSEDEQDDADEGQAQADQESHGQQRTGAEAAPGPRECESSDGSKASGPLAASSQAQAEEAAAGPVAAASSASSSQKRLAKALDLATSASASRSTALRLLEHHPDSFDWGPFRFTWTTQQNARRTASGKPSALTTSSPMPQAAPSPCAQAQMRLPRTWPKGLS